VIAALTVIAVVAGLAVAGLRWARVAQVEHYLPGSALTVSSRWWTSHPLNIAAVIFGVAALGLGPLGAWLTLVVFAAGPLGLPLRGRTSRLRTTRRALTLLAVWGVLSVLLLALLTPGMGFPLVMAGAVAVLLAPALFDLAARLLLPVENRIGRRWAVQAREKLAKSGAKVVAITGSYGKTGTKGLVAHLLSGSQRVLASPASWNNRAGLARAVNEQLAPGTEVFVAEMGTYGPGEIADMCRWFPPNVSVMTAIGPVHLERFGSLERTLESKAEILETASHAVLNTDDERLATLAERLVEERPELRIWRCSASAPEADVAVLNSEEGSVEVLVQGRVITRLPVPAVPTVNLACAVAAVLACGVGEDQIAGRLTTPLPQADHRLTESKGAKGFTILDDTFNSNPAGAVRALETLRSVDGAGRRVVVTPGMVELGPLQDEANEAFAAAASEVASDLVVVGRTNRRPLLRGAKRTGLAVVEKPNREAAVEWVKANLGPGDAVLYENDLPDVYP
jgi:UDP-N-acetylmuramoyl-tripeptide--D-alanyl-D-alanine ligase